MLILQKGLYSAEVDADEIEVDEDEVTSDSMPDTEVDEDAVEVDTDSVELDADGIIPDSEPDLDFVPECTDNETRAVDGIVSTCRGGKWEFTGGTVLIGTSVVDSGKSAAVDSFGIISITGESKGYLDELTNAGSYDVFLKIVTAE